MFLSSVRVQLTLWNVLVLMVVLFGCGVALLLRTQAYLKDGVDRSLEDRARPMLIRRPPPGPPPGIAAGMGVNMPGPRGTGAGEQPAPPPGFGPPSGPPGPGQPMPRRPPPDIRVLNTNRIDPESGLPPFDQTVYEQSLRGQSLWVTIDEDRESWRVYSAPQRNELGDLVGVVQAEQPLAPVESEIADLTRMLLTLIPIGMIAAGLGGAFLAARALRPVQQIASTVDRIQATNLGERLPARGGDEFAHLASTVNSMLARLQAAFDDQRRFTMDASHELKTPLTVIKAKTSVALTRPRTAEAYRATLETVDRAADQMADIVQDLLLLAQADSGQLGGDRAVLPVREIAERAVAGAWSDSGPKVEIDIPDTGIVVCGNSLQLTRAVRNLVQNAIDHTAASGRVKIAAGNRANEVEIKVSDTGEGIEAEHIPHLTERFYRVDAARSRESGGSGLGLAIVKSIIDAHGGRIEIQSIPGSGTQVRLFLPQSR